MKNPLCWYSSKPPVPDIPATNQWSNPDGEKGWPPRLKDHVDQGGLRKFFWWKNTVAAVAVLWKSKNCENKTVDMYNHIKIYIYILYVYNVDISRICNVYILYYITYVYIYIYYVMFIYYTMNPIVEYERFNKILTVKGYIWTSRILSTPGWLYRDHPRWGWNMKPPTCICIYI